MTQVDVLAAVVALWDAQRPILELHEETIFRKELDAREPALKFIRDAHDCHKHGGLHRKTAAASQGQRPEQVTRLGLFFNHSFFGGLPTPYDVLVIVLDDGTEKEVYCVLHEAMQAWEREQSVTGLPL
jgi:hypothetical protein